MGIGGKSVRTFKHKRERVVLSRESILEALYRVAREEYGTNVEGWDMIMQDDGRVIFTRETEVKNADH